MERSLRSRVQDPQHWSIAGHLLCWMRTVIPFLILLLLLLVLLGNANLYAAAAAAGRWPA